MKGSSKDEEEPEPSHLNNIEVISGESPVKGSSRDEEEPELSHLNNSEVISGESHVKGHRNSGHKGCVIVFKCSINKVIN